jgi:hypothetical protein
MNINDLNLETILLLIILGLSLLLPLLRSPWLKGIVGERRVRSRLDAMERTYGEYCPFHDVVLNTPDGTTQIDHILVSPYGIFIIETKNLRGWIYGDTRARNWTQVLYRDKFKFMNPLHQNYKHVKAAQNLLGLKETMFYSVVVFVGDNKFKTPMPENIVKLRRLVPFIKSHTERILQKKSVDTAIQNLLIAQQRDFISASAHVQNVKQNMEEPLCPKCGKQMVLRTARKGPGAGSQFWGCSGFPNCRMTKSMDYQ